MPFNYGMPINAQCVRLQSCTSDQKKLVFMKRMYSGSGTQ